MNNRVQQKEQLVINDLVAQVNYSSFMSHHPKNIYLGREYCSSIAPKLCRRSINWPFLQFDVHDSSLSLIRGSLRWTYDVIITILLVPLLDFTIFRYLLHLFLCNKNLFTRKQKKSFKIKLWCSDEWLNQVIIRVLLNVTISGTVGSLKISSRLVSLPEVHGQLVFSVRGAAETLVFSVCPVLFEFWSIQIKFWSAVCIQIIQSEIKK